MEETIATMPTEMTEIATSDPELLAHVQNIETLLTYIAVALVFIFLYGCFKLSTKFFSMFF